MGLFRLSLKDGYPEALAELNIFPSKYTFQNTDSQNYSQIDELKFEKMLINESTRGYSEQNRINDTQSLAVVLRLRQSAESKDLANSKFVLVTSNTHFARSARRFARAELGFTSRYVPAVLTHAQMSTAAWMSNETKVMDSFISRELVANCMSAQQLSREWVDGFVEIMKEASLPEEDNTIMHAVRAIARDESLSNPAVLRRLNPNEMIKRAKMAEEQRLEELEARHKEDLNRRLSESEGKVRREERNIISTENQKRSERLANHIVRVIKLLLLGCFVYVLVQGIGKFEFSEYRTWFQPGAFVLVTIIAVLDVVGFRPVSRLTDPMRKIAATAIYRYLYAKE